MGILSVQSQVSYGHVGNSAAVFVLQSMGHQVWPIDTVHLSNHPGYPVFRGSVVPAQAISELVEGLDLNGWLGDCQAVLSGYLGSLENAHAMLDAVARVRAQQADAVYICDPVMGDSPEGLYVAAELPAFYRSHAVPQADVLTPNLFELELLVGSSLPTVETVCQAARSLISLGPERVIVTSLPGPPGTGMTGTLLVTENRAWRVDVPTVDQEVKGAGDVLTALWAGHWLTGMPPAQALAQAVSGLYPLIVRCQHTANTELAIVAQVEQTIRPALLYDARNL